jgi:hypothetical protein
MLAVASERVGPHRSRQSPRGRRRAAWMAARQLTLCDRFDGASETRTGDLLSAITTRRGDVGMFGSAEPSSMFSSAVRFAQFGSADGRSDSATCAQAFVARTGGEGRSRSEAKKRRAAATAIATYSPSEKPGFCDGKTAAASDQTMSANTISQLQLALIRMPAIRPSWNVGFTRTSMDEGRPRAPCPALPRA